jgi:hypothetical protein
MKIRVNEKRLLKSGSLRQVIGLREGFDKIIEKEDEDDYDEEEDEKYIFG